MRSSIKKKGGRGITNLENELFQSILKYDKYWLKKRNAILRTSFKYKPDYHRIAKKLFDESNFKLQKTEKQKLPNFFIGPQLKPGRSKFMPSCGYGLGYYKVGKNKFYINPRTGLVSHYVNEANEGFNGEDSTTSYGTFKGKDYYIDKNGIPYFYKGNYKQIFNSWEYLEDIISPNGFPKARSNPYFWKREFYFDSQYPKIKKMVGVWQDLRATRRNEGSRWYKLEIKKN
jgi:hypothetical protein